MSLRSGRWILLPVVVVLTWALASCAGQNPDYVVTQRPPDCDPGSRLVRRGYPENLEELFIGNCTVTHTKNMRGPDFSRWLNAVSPPWTSCDGPVEIWFWVERDMLGEISRVHFCPEACTRLLEEMRFQLKQDLVCESDAGMPASTGVAGGVGGAGGVLPVAGATAAVAGTSAITP